MTRPLSGPGIQNVVASAGSRPDLELLVLFGSRAKGRSGPDSDVDLALLCDQPADLDAWYGILAPLAGTDRLDLVDLRRADPTLALEVARTGRLLFERRPGAFRRFQALASCRFADTAKLRVAQRRTIRVFLERHGLG